VLILPILEFFCVSIRGAFENIMCKIEVDSLWNLSQAAAWILYRRNDWIEALTSGGGANFGAMQLYPSLNPRPEPALGTLSDLHNALKCGHLSATGIRPSDTERVRTPIPKDQWQDLDLQPPKAVDTKTGREVWEQLRVSAAVCKKLWRGPDETKSRTKYDWVAIKLIYDEVAPHRPDFSDNRLIEELQLACAERDIDPEPSRSILQNKLKLWRSSQ
jgi:hypothetical protein